MEINFVIYLIVFLGVINLLRMSTLLIGADIYNLKQHLKKSSKSLEKPKISVVIPAYNEEKSILNCLMSVLESNYPTDKLDIIVVNDGSKDNTERVVKNFLSSSRYPNVKLITQQNMGKAHALNNGMKNYATGQLVVCLDADSYLDKYALQNAVVHFEDLKVMALATNVKIAAKKGYLNLIQTFEYLICYQMKRALTNYNIEYIIGGVGSIFRASYLKEVGYYDTNTVTEDIDLTMKILRAGNKNVRVIYGSDVVAYTQAALTISDLLRQRFRWKWGRYQAFWKNKSMFFSGDQEFSKGLSWVYLPFAIFSDLALLFEPAVLIFLLYLITVEKDYATIFSTISVTSFYIIMNLLAEDTIVWRQKLKLVLFVPAIYFLFFVLSFIEYLALIKSLLKLPNLRLSLGQNKNTWQPVNRSGFVAE